MRTLAIVLVFGLAVSSMAVFKKAKPFKADISSIENMKKKTTVTFGDFVNFFQTHTFQQNDQLVAFLDQLAEDINQEHRDHLDLYTENRAACDDEYAFRAAEIDAATDSLGRSQAALHHAQGEQTRAANLGDLAAQSLVSYEAALDELRVNRAAAIALYNQRVGDLVDAQDALAVAQNILDEFELEANGDIPAGLIQITNTLLAITVKTGHAHKMLPIYTTLIQNQNGQFYVSAVQELRELFATMVDNVTKAQNRLDDQEAEAAATFASDEAYYVQVIGQLNDQLNLSAEYIARLAGIIEQENSISLEANGKIARNTELLEQAHGLCDDNDVEFQQGESIRRGQLELIAQLKTAVQALEVQYAQSLLPNIQDLVGLDE